MIDKIRKKREKRTLRHRRVRALVKGSQERPRLSVFRSNKHIWAQLIDDVKRQTMASASDLELVSSDSKEKKGKTEVAEGKKGKAFLVGRLIAKKAQGLGIEKVVFDRGGWKYHGRIKALSEGARKGGLKF